MRRVLDLYRSTIGQKVAMAVTGALLLVYVLGHMAGNLKVFQGPEKFNAYAEFLRDVGAPVLGHGQLLWIVRITLLAAVLIHITAAYRLALLARNARPVNYRRPVHLETSYASRTLLLGGTVIFAYLIYHILHLTLGSVHPDFVPGDAYHNLVAGLQVPAVSLAYVVAMIALAFHMYHGVWSALQTMGVNTPGRNRWRRIAAALFTAVVFVGFITVPLAVLAGIIA